MRNAFFVAIEQEFSKVEVQLPESQVSGNVATTGATESDKWRGIVLP